MDPLFQDERISAYLDGQMPPDERSQFEDELARNGELRQVVEELRGLHESLQALPRQRLGDDFAEHVLRRAERAMLTDSRVGASAVGANGANGADKSAAEEPHVVRPAISETGKSRRPWIWAAIAIAVAVMLMVLNPPPNKHDKVAHLDSTPRAHAAQRADSAASAPHRGNSEESLHEPQLSVPAGGVATDGSSNQRSADLASNTKESDRSQTAGEPERLRSIAGQNGAAGNVDAAAQGAAAPTTNFDRRRELAKSAAPATPATTPSHAATAEKAMGAGGRLAQQGDVEFRQNGIRSAAAPEGAVGAQPQSFAGSANQPGGKGSAVGEDNADETPRGTKGGFAKNREQSLQGRSFEYVQGDQGKRELPAGDMIVAEVETRSEVSPAKLQQLLDKRGITLNNSPAALLALTSAVRRASAMDIAQSSGASAGENAPVADAADKNAAKDVDAKAGADKSRAVAKNADQPSPKSISRSETRAPTDALKLAESDREVQETAADKESLEVVYVVGTRQQVLGLVDDLHSQPEQYRTLAVTTVSPEATDGLEKDAKGLESRVFVDDLAAGAKTDRDGEEVRAARKLSRPFAPAPPAAPPVASAAPPAPLKPEPALAADGHAQGADAPAVLKKDGAEGRAGGQAIAAKPGAVAAPIAAPITAEQKAIEAAPTAEAPSPVAADAESAAEPADRSSGSGWAARMPLPPEAENLLRKSLAERENPPADDKAKSVAQRKQQATLRDALGRGDGGGAPDDQVQAVLVFRLMPGKARPAVAAPAK